MYKCIISHFQIQRIIFHFWNETQLSIYFEKNPIQKLKLTNFMLTLSLEVELFSSPEWEWDEMIFTFYVL